MIPVNCKIDWCSSAKWPAGGPANQVETRPSGEPIELRQSSIGQIRLNYLERAKKGAQTPIGRPLLVGGARAHKQSQWTSAQLESNGPARDSLGAAWARLKVAQLGRASLSGSPGCCAISRAEVRVTGPTKLGCSQWEEFACSLCLVGRSPSKPPARQCPTLRPIIWLKRASSARCKGRKKLAR